MCWRLVDEDNGLVLLPNSIIRQETESRARVLAESQGFLVGRRQMRDLKMREKMVPGLSYWTFAESPALMDDPSG